MNPTYHRHSPLPRHLALAISLALVAVLLSGTGALASGKGGYSLVIDGAGDGHGVGMSQEGALGYAEHGYSYTQILSHYYTGTAIGTVPAGEIVRVEIGSKVHDIPLETYVRGVVSAEVPASWPMAALEAQAVASRTYALTAHSGGAKFDVYADARSQVYEGKIAETPRTNAAVAATAGQVVTYQGSPVVTYFFASSGGRTESIQNAFLGASPKPWLVSVADPYDQGPLHSWKLTLTFADVTRRLKGLLKGSFQGIEVLKRGDSPRIVSAMLLGSRGSTQISGPELAARLGLDATWAYFEIEHAGNLRAEPDLSKQSAAPEGLSSSTEPAPSGGTPATGPDQQAPSEATPAAAAKVGPQGGVRAG